MKTEKLFGLLKLINGVTCNNWSMVTDLVKCINEEKVKVVSKKWNDDFKNKYKKEYPLDLSKIETWSTYPQCVDLRFFIKNGNICCIAKIHDGDFMHGYRKNIRFTAELILPNDFITKIESTINYIFEKYLEEKYETHLDSKKNEWINKLKSKIIKDI